MFDLVLFQSYYSLIFNSPSPYDYIQKSLFQSYYSLIFNMFFSSSFLSCNISILLQSYFQHSRLSVNCFPSNFNPTIVLFSTQLFFFPFSYIIISILLQSYFQLFTLCFHPVHECYFNPTIVLFSTFQFQEYSNTIRYFNPTIVLFST